MSKELSKAQVEYQAGEYKRAVDTLWEVVFVGAEAEAEARSVIALASLLRDATRGGVRHDCEEHIARAERFLAAGGGSEAERARAAELARQLCEEAVSEARAARAAGLGWFELRRGTDIVAAEMRSVRAVDPFTAASPPASTIDAVEAEGWRLEHVACMFRPTTVQTSALRGAEYFMGGQLVEGDELYIYLFRRVDEAAD